jgi:hypothetical protein
MRYNPAAPVTARFANRIRKVHAAGLVSQCSAVQSLRGRHIVETLCEGARNLGLRYVGERTRKHWEPVPDSHADVDFGGDGSPTEAHGDNLLKGNSERALAVEDVILFADACGMNVMSFELPGDAENVFDQHVDLARAGFRMNRDARLFLRDYLVNGALARARGIPESIDLTTLEVLQEGTGEPVLGRARRLAADGGAPIRIYMEKKFYWVRLHQPPAQLGGAQAYYLDHFPPQRGDDPHGVNLDIIPLPSRATAAERLDLAKLELFGNQGAGRMAILLVREDGDALKTLPGRLDQFARVAADAMRSASALDGKAKDEARDLENEAFAERVRWLTSSLPPERLWLVRRDYTLLSGIAA